MLSTLEHRAEHTPLNHKYAKEDNGPGGSERQVLASHCDELPLGALCAKPGPTCLISPCHITHFCSFFLHEAECGCRVLDVPGVGKPPNSILAIFAGFMLKGIISSQTSVEDICLASKLNYSTWKQAFFLSFFQWVG